MNTSRAAQSASEQSAGTVSPRARNERLLLATLSLLVAAAILGLVMIDATGRGRAAETTVGAGEVAGAGDDEQEAETGEDREESGEEYWKKPIEEWTLDQVREFQAFIYVSGGRNPFDFRLARQAEAGGGEKPEPGTGTKTPGGRNQMPNDKAQKLFFLEQIQRMELLLVAHNYKAAVKVGEQVRDLVINKWGGTPTRKDNYLLFQRVLAYHRTAKRLRRIEETRKEFEGFVIDIKAIRWTPQGSTVLIRDRIYEPGNVLKDIHSASPIQIETIREDGVIFLYKGQHFRKDVVQEPQAKHK